jgi:hypothetical protein
MNIVDGIFTSQVGVKVSLATPTLFRTSTDPFSDTLAPKDLLNELSTYRAGSQAQRALGITHLMTGRNLDGTTVGIAYIKGLCSAQIGVSLSQGTFNTLQSALIAAHEMGHNFGAPHDGESGSACESTTQPYLMAQQLNNSQTFSPCSIQQMTPVINAAQCLTAYLPPDVGITVPTTALPATVGTAFVASFTVRAQGDDASSSVTATVNVPAELTVNSASANGGSCSSGGGSVTCTLGTLAAGDARQVDLNLTASVAGDRALGISIASSNDGNTSNNSGTLNITATGASAPTPPSTPPSSGNSSGGGGGGGSMDFLMLAALGGTFLLRRKRR